MVKQKTNTKPMGSPLAFPGSMRTSTGYHPLAPEAKEPISVVAPDAGAPIYLLAPGGEPLGSPVSQGMPIEDPKPCPTLNGGPLGGPVDGSVGGPVSKGIHQKITK